ncbi:MAG: hypothetical protein O2964_05555, partial [Verrucomicrobia bacterium]|nr:hypothetical protein [Verrucomicrobiota bacterium]
FHDFSQTNLSHEVASSLSTPGPRTHQKLPGLFDKLIFYKHHSSPQKVSDYGEAFCLGLAGSIFYDHATP